MSARALFSFQLPSTTIEVIDERGRVLAKNRFATDTAGRRSARFASRISAARYRSRLIVLSPQPAPMSSAGLESPILRTDREESWAYCLASSSGSAVGTSVPDERKQHMASLVLKMSVSLDGYVAPADGSTGWEAAGRGPDGTSWVLETVTNAGLHLVGAATYLRWASFWPSASGPFAKPMNDIPKLVFSNSLQSADWAETTIISGDLSDAITRLKDERSGGYLLAQGGVRIARSLVETGLIDEYRLVVHPVVLGAGERLFTAPLTVEPISAVAFSSGAAGHVFAAHP